MLYLSVHLPVQVKYLQPVESMRQESVHLSCPKDLFMQVLRKKIEKIFDPFKINMAIIIITIKIEINLFPHVI